MATGILEKAYLMAKTTIPLSDAEYAQMQADSLNELYVPGGGYECAECRNKGVVHVVSEDNEVLSRPCECRKIRESLKLVEESGLSAKLGRETFDSFLTDEPYQRQLKRLAVRYLRDYDKPETGRLRPWLYISGKSGRGKTHICTAVVGKLLSHPQRPVPCRYMVWQDEIKRIKATATDDEARRELIEPLKTVECLYIDDFLKVRSGTQPTDAEINAAIELINHRYNSPRALTIISSELPLTEILCFDESLGSKIYERSRDYKLHVESGANYRMTDGAMT